MISSTPPLLDLSRAALAGAARAELAAIEAELERRQWCLDPISWVEHRTGTFLWSKQKQILRSVARNRRTAVRSCHGPGKSFTAAQAVAWWIDSHPHGQAMAVTTAPTDTQVRAILWKEIRRVHSRVGLPGRTNLKEWYLEVDGTEQLAAIGMKPSDYSPTSFQGIHARYVLIVLDEACGIPGKNADTPHSLWVAAESLMVNEDCRILAVGNPDDPTSEFASVCRPGSGWNVISVSAFETPCFTGEDVPEGLRKELVGHVWVEERRREWAPGWRWNEKKTAILPPAGTRIEDAHPLWLSKVLGQFPENKTAQGLIPLSWIEAAQKRDLSPGDPLEFGVDVGGGGDASTVAFRRGGVVRIIHEDFNPDTMQTCGNVVALMRDTGATLVKVDKSGIGWGMVNRGQEQGLPFVGIQVGEASTDPERFANLRAEGFWRLRERFEAGEIDLDPTDHQTAAELCSLRFSRTSRGQVLIEAKEQARRRGIKSPNRADAIMLAFLEERPPAPSGPSFEVLW